MTACPQLQEVVRVTGYRATDLCQVTDILECHGSKKDGFGPKTDGFAKVAWTVPGDTETGKLIPSSWEGAACPQVGNAYIFSPTPTHRDM